MAGAEEYADSASYQQLNSVMAIGSGQLTGKGYNNDEAISVNRTEISSLNRRLILFLRSLEKNWDLWVVVQSYFCYY